LHKKPERIACDGCKAAARELREFADQSMKSSGPGPIPQLAEIPEVIGI